jgi:threonyl-tRNA synthetase
MLKIPYIGVIGRRELEADSIALRVRGSAEKAPPKVVPIEEFIGTLRAEILERAVKA